MELTQWFPAEGETGVQGRFAWHDLLDIPASLVADEERTKRIVVLYTKIAGSNDVAPPAKVLPHNKAAFIKRFPKAWEAFNGADVKVDGSPLTQPFHGLTLTADRAMNFQIRSVQTWEQLMALSDELCEQLGFGTRKLRNDALIAAGQMVPGKPPIPAQQFDAARVNAPLQHQGEPPEPPKSFSPVPGIDMNDPEVAAAAIAAMQAVLKARNQHKEPAGATVEVPADSSPPAPETPVLSSQAAPDAPAGKKHGGGWPKGHRRGPDGKPVPPESEAA
jgi:hypothetical protein